ncbi:hypothetical protein AALA80_12850 [Oscillospiraceae bacterium 50-60]
MTEREELEMWKEMYLHLLRETEKAINLLVRGEQHTEDLYIKAGHSSEQYSTDTMCAKQWVPITTVGRPGQIGFARAFRYSKEDEMKMEAYWAAKKAEEARASQDSDT